MHGNKLFQDLTLKEKVDFLVACQNLLVTHHPDSDFIFRTNNFSDRLNYAQKFIKRYQGYYYQSDNLCLFYNFIKVTDGKEPVEVLKEKMYRPPEQDFNAIIIDFVVFRKLHDCAEFYKSHVPEQIKYVLYVKNSKVKLYLKDKIIANLHISI